jgi:thiamine-phosphate pyrophosphorylase
LKRLVLPRLYVILDARLVTTSETEIAQKLADAGVRLLQYRNKRASARELFEVAKRLSARLRPQGVTFIVNDRADIAAAVDASGIHVGQEDLPVAGARMLAGSERIVGVSTHSAAQFEEAVATTANYIAVGPVFATSSKDSPDPVVGVELIRRVRGLTEKSIVAIGGITLETAAEVIRAGADSVAVIGDILGAPDPAKRAQEFLQVLDAANHAAAN